MKYFLLITFVFISMTLQLKAQIPNYNFENWSNGANNAPDGWKNRGSNTVGFNPATQTTDNYFGNYAVRLENKISGTALYFSRDVDPTFGR